MNDTPTYIAIPRTPHRTERIDALLEKRMKEFLLARRRQVCHDSGEATSAHARALAGGANFQIYFDNEAEGRALLEK